MQRPVARMRWLQALAPLRLDRGSVLAVGLCAGTFCGWTLALAHAVTVPEVLYFALLPLAAVYLGRAALHVLNLRPSFPLAYLTGSLGLALVMLGLKAALPLAMGTAAGIAFALAPLLLLAGSLARPLRPVRTRKPEVGVVALALAAATLWSQDLFRPVERGEAVVVFRPWADYFIHAVVPAMLSRAEALPRVGDYECAGRPPILYHYASYCYPAGLMSCGHLTAYQSLLAFWSPCGTFLVGLAAYALGRSLGGRRGGLAALMGVLLLPDASYYGLRSPQFNFDRMLQSAPGLAYGIAAAAVALVWLLEGIRRRNPRALGGGLALGGLVVLFKAQIFFAAFPLLVLLALAFYQPSSRRLRLTLAAGGAALGWLLLALADRYHIGPTIRFDGSGFARWIGDLAGSLPDSRFRPWFATLAAGGAGTGHEARGLLLLAAATFGLALPLYAALLALGLWRRRVRWQDGIPLLAVAIYLFCALRLCPNGRIGTWTELVHRPYTWAYFITACTAMALLARRIPRKVFARAAAGTSCLLLAVPLGVGRHLQAPRAPWMKGFINLPVPAGLVQCADFVRRQGAAAALVQDSRCDEALIVAALSEHPAFLARPRGKPWTQNQEQLELVERFFQARSWGDLRDLVNRTHIRWWLAHPGDTPAWPAALRARPVFESQGYRVYDFSSLAGAEVAAAP